MPEFLLILRPSREGFAETITDEERSIVAKHFAYLSRAHADGTLILAGRTQEPTPVGLVVIRAESRDAAEGFASGDPAVHAGLFRYDLKEYEVALMEGRPR